MFGGVQFDFNDPFFIKKKSTSKSPTFTPGSDEGKVIDTTNKLLTSSRSLFTKIQNKQSKNPISETFDIIANIFQIGAVFQPTFGLSKQMMLLIKVMTDMWHSKYEEKQSEDGHFLTLMGIALNDKDLSAARSGLKQLLHEIQAQMDDLIKKQKISQHAASSVSSSLAENIKFLKKSVNESQIAEDQKIWMTSCKFVYETYTKVAVQIRQNLQKCVDTINATANTLKVESAKKIIEQIYEFIHLLYFRFVVFMMMASMFGNGPPNAEDSKLFENKDTIIHKLNASNHDLLSKLRFLSRPKLENRIIVTLFYHRSHHSKAMDILERFDTHNFTFSNPESDFCPHWDRSNSVSHFFRLMTKKWPEEKYCFGVDKNYQIRSCKKSNNLAVQRVGGCKHQRNGFGQYRLFALYEDKKGTKWMRVYLYKNELWATDYMTLKAVSDQDYEFVIFKIFDDAGDFFYISPLSRPDRYVYMRANGDGDVFTYDGVKNKPTEQSYWICLRGTKTANLESLPNYYK